MKRNGVSVCVLLNTAIDVINHKGYILKREEDRDFLLSIKNHEMEYDDILKIVQEKQQELDKGLTDSTIQDHLDKEKVKTLVFNTRKLNNLISNLIII